MSLPSPPRVGVGVFVFRSKNDPAFIIGIRKGSNGAGTNALPGGHLEYGESFEECAAREVREETGLKLIDTKFVTAVNSVFVEAGLHYVTVFMVGLAAPREDGSMEPELLEPEKCEGWRWCTFADMRTIGEDREKLFLPLVNLIADRPEVCTQLERGVQ